MIHKVDCQDDTDPQKLSQLMQHRRNFWLCFNVLRGFSVNCQQWKGRVCDYTEIIYEFLKNFQAHLLRDESRA